MDSTGYATVLSWSLLLSNPIFLSSVTAFIVSQVIKAFVSFFTNKDKGFKYALVTLVWSTGGMPSSHASLVSALAASTAIYDGLGSPLFAISLFLALIVMRDALGVRRAAGLQAKALNILGRRVEEKLGGQWDPIKEIQGHRPLEVVVGGVLGVISALIFGVMRG